MNAADTKQRENSFDIFIRVARRDWKRVVGFDPWMPASDGAVAVDEGFIRYVRAIWSSPLAHALPASITLRYYDCI